MTMRGMMDGENRKDEGGENESGEDGSKLV